MFLLFVVVVVVTVVAVGAAVLGSGGKVGHVYVDHETVPGLMKWLYRLSWVNAACMVFYCSYLHLLHGSDPRYLPLWLWIGFGLGVLLTFFFVMINLVTAKLVGWDFILEVVFGFLREFPRPLKFTSQPVVLDVGEGHYSIVFAANRRSQGYVTYVFEGREYQVNSTHEGILRAETIHAVRVPYEHLEHNTYQVHALRCQKILSHGGYRSKTPIHGESIYFRGVWEVEHPTWLHATDWHGRIPQLEQAMQHVKSPDLVVCTGDSNNDFSGPTVVSKYLLGGLHVLSKGQIPVIFARGNHETRGNFDIGTLARTLGLPGFYYQVVHGAFCFTVVDTAEAAFAKESDKFNEGYTDMEPYFLQELAWLESLQPVPEKYSVVLSHDPMFNLDKNTQKEHRETQFVLSRRYFSVMRKLGVRLGFCGHTHSPQFRETDGFITIDGGAYFRRVKKEKGLLDVIHKDICGVMATQIEFQEEKIRVTWLEEDGKIRAEQETARFGALPDPDGIPQIS